MSNAIFSIASLLLGYIIFLFFYWSKLKEDYASDEIFTTGFYFLILSTLLGIISSKFVSQQLSSSPYFSAQGIWFWAAVMGFLLSFLISIRLFTMNAYEVFEGASIGMLPFLSFTILLHPSLPASFPSMALGVLPLLVFASFFILESKYKKFSWYHSGKIGFASLISLGTFFLIRSIFSFFYPAAPSLIGMTDVILSAVVAFLLFFTVYNRAEQ